MATPDFDSGADAQDTAEAFDETHNTDEDVSPDETRSFAPDLFDDVYDVTKAEGDEDEDDEALDAADYNPDDLDDDDLEDDDESAAAYLADDEDDDFDDEDEDEEDGILAASADDAELEYAADVDDAGRTDNRQARRFESSHELSEEQVKDLGYGGRDTEESSQDAEGSGSGAHADDVEDESHPRQEKLLDEGIEESFPASDPVSVKRIT